MNANEETRQDSVEPIESSPESAEVTPQPEQTPVEAKDQSIPIYKIPDRARVQYVGDAIAAYKGMSGTLAGHTPEGEAAVIFDGASVPVKIPESDLIVASDSMAAKPDALMTSKEPRFRFIANTSGGMLWLPDLTNDAEPDGIGMKPGDKMDLLQFFTPEQINRARSLPDMAKKISGNNGLPCITELKSLDEELPEGSIVTPLGELHKAGTVVEADPNLYDDLMDKDLEKEEKRNEEAAAMSRRERRTTQHGKGSEKLGR